MGNPWHDVSPGDDVEKGFLAIIEIPKGSKNKYELDKKTGLLMADRVLYSSVHYPANYGFIPHSLSADGDPCDVLVASQVPVVPGAVIRCRPVGALVMEDEAGGDEKILAVPVEDPRFDGVGDISEIHKHWLSEIENFFNTYKMLEGKETRIEDWFGAEQARKVIRMYRSQEEH